MRKRNRWRWGISFAIVAMLVGLAILQRDEVVSIFKTLQQAHVGWLAVSVVLQLVVYLIFAIVMHQSLVMVRHPLPLTSILPFSFTGIVLNRFLVAGGTTVEVLGLLNRGVPQGTTTVVLSLNIVSGVSAFGLMLVGGIVYQLTQGSFDLRGMLALTGGLLVAVLAGVSIVRQGRDRTGLTRKALRLQHKVGRLARRTFAPESMLRFIAETYDSVALIRTDVLGFVRLVGLHLTALLLDCVGLSLLFVALDFQPNFLLILLGYALAYVVATITSLPGGGGSFETAMAVTFTQLGVPGHLALSVTLLYRMIAFWLPLLAVAFTATAVRRKRSPQTTAALRAASQVK